MSRERMTEPDRGGMGNGRATARRVPYGAVPKDWRPAEWTAREKYDRVRGRQIRFIDIDDVTDRGTVLLVHGIGASYRSWLTTIPALARHRRVIALDLPGFGDSERDPAIRTPQAMASFIDEFCDTVQAGAVSVVGHSMGGLLAMQLAADFPGRVRQLAVVSASLRTALNLFRHPVRSVRRSPRISASFAFQLATAVTPIPKPILRLALGHPTLRSITCASYVHRPTAVNRVAMFEAFSATGRAGNLVAVTTAGRYDLEQVVASLSERDIPVLVVVGNNDRLADARDSTYLQQRIPTVRLVRLPATGHWPTLERPIELNDLLCEWLETGR